MSATESILLAVAHEHSQQFAAGTIKSPWDYFEYSVKLALARWTALRMAVEGEWGGGDTRRKYEILLEEILNVFKYNKTVYADAMVDNISGYVETEFGLICEDGSVEEISELLTVLADECKKAQYDRVKAMHDQVQSLFPIDLKAAKIKTQDDGVGLAEGVLHAGVADFVGFGRPFLVNPDLPARFRNDWPLAEPLPYELFWNAKKGLEGYHFPAYDPKKAEADKEKQANPVDP
ncbi:hypothetical protein ON010_g15563 [Phytophthora cinnamomi]|nr:hypothetical protein ON010_g15563 [Phytophthora cinnamomi]